MLWYISQNIDIMEPVNQQSKVFLKRDAYIQKDNPGKKGIKLDHIRFYLIRLIFYSIKYNFESVAIECNRSFVYIKMNMIEYDHVEFYLIRFKIKFNLIKINRIK